MALTERQLKALAAKELAARELADQKLADLMNPYVGVPSETKIDKTPVRLVVPRVMNQIGGNMVSITKEIALGIMHNDFGSDRGIVYSLVTGVAITKTAKGGTSEKSKGSVNSLADDFADDFGDETTEVVGNLSLFLSKEVAVAQGITGTVTENDSIRLPYSELDKVGFTDATFKYSDISEDQAKAWKAAGLPLWTGGKKIGEHTNIDQMLKRLLHLLTTPTKIVAGLEKLCTVSYVKFYDLTKFTKYLAVVDGLVAAKKIETDPAKRAIIQLDLENKGAAPNVVVNGYTDRKLAIAFGENGHTTNKNGNPYIAPIDIKGAMWYKLVYVLGWEVADAYNEYLKVWTAISGTGFCIAVAEDVTVEPKNVVDIPTNPMFDGKMVVTATREYKKQNNRAEDKTFNTVIIIGGTGSWATQDEDLGKAAKAAKDISVSNDGTDDEF